MLEPTIPAPHPAPAPADAPSRRRPAPATPTATSSARPHRFPFSADRAYTPPDSGIDDFERLQDRLGLSRAVFVQASCHGTDNSAMVDALATWRGSLRRRGDDRRVVHRRRHRRAARRRGARHPIQLRRPPRRRTRARRVLANRRPGRSRSAGTSCCTSTPRTSPTTPTCSTAMPCPYVIDHMARVPRATGSTRSRSRHCSS